MEWAATKPQIRRLWIFGSRFAGNASDASDIDIAVETFHEPDWEVSLTDLWIEFGECWERELAQKLPWPIDLEFFDPAGTTPRIEGYLAKGSRLVYAKAS